MELKSREFARGASLLELGGVQEICGHQRLFRRRSGRGVRCPHEHPEFIDRRCAGRRVSGSSARYERGLSVWEVAGISSPSGSGCGLVRFQVE